MRVLISAYACAPGEGSEPGVGWAWSTAAAEIADVVVLTRSNNVEAIEAALAKDPRALSIEVVGTEGPEWLRRIKKRLPFGTQLYYIAWQRSAARVAKRLHARRAFDLTHHVTFAVDWLPANAVQLSDVPFVWGPVAGATYSPVAAFRWLGFRGATKESLRRLITMGLRRTWGRRNARLARLVVAGSSDTAAAFASLGVETIVEPNCVVEPVAGWQPSTRTGLPRVAVVGRLVPWKGVRLAAAVADRLGDEAVVEFFGEGPERRWLEKRRARATGRGGMVLHGKVDRASLLERLEHCDVLLACSLHESIGWAAAEAVALGLPVVATDLGGHRDVLARVDASRLVPVTSGAPLRLELALRDALRGPGKPTQRWTARRLPDLLQGLYERVTQGA